MTYLNKSNRYGIKRAIEPEMVLPTSAWKVDNKENLYDNEIKISLRTIHIEGTSFRQICMECHEDDEAIRQKIIDIIIMRGKLHNPISDTGGVLYGVVEEIGENYNSNGRNLKKGDAVICNVSLASIPLHISTIGKIDRSFNQIEAKGYAIAHDAVPVIKKPQGLPINLLMYVFNESGTLYSLSKEVYKKKKILVVGTNMLMNLIYGYTIRKVAGDDVKVINFVDKRNKIIMNGDMINKLLNRTFNETYYGNILKPIESMEILGGVEDFDMVANCSEFPGAEPLTILASAHSGTVVFGNLSKNYNSALYITESLAKEVVILNAEGYLEKYDDFDFEIVGELSKYFEKQGTISQKGLEENSSNEEDRFDVKGESRKKTRVWRKDLPEEFIVKSLKMEKVLYEAIRVSKYDCNVLITGDTGVGKEKIANIIQKSSDRKIQPFIKVNCAAIQPSLMESEFFGYEPGAFTGANTLGKKGYFELADNGILFLDEIGEIPLDMQAKLLRVIQEGEFYRVGGSKLIKSNFRIISAANKNLESKVEEGNFRRDLYYRLNVVAVRIPDLEERKEDIIPLVVGFLQRYGKRFGEKKNITEEALFALENYKWKGNIRELENTVQRLIIASTGNSIELMDVLQVLNDDTKEHSVGVEYNENIKLDDLLESYEKQILKRAYENYGSTRKAAKAIGISQTQFVRKKNKYGI